MGAHLLSGRCAHLEGLDVRPIVTIPAADQCQFPLAGTHYPSH